MDKGYEDDLTRQLVESKGFNPLVPPKSNRKKPWTYNKNSTNDAMRWSGYFVASKASGECAHAMKNLMLCTWLSLT